MEYLKFLVRTKIHPSTKNYLFDDYECIGNNIYLVKTCLNKKELSELFETNDILDVGEEVEDDKVRLDRILGEINKSGIKYISGSDYLFLRRYK